MLRLVVYSWPNATKREVRQVAERRFLIRADEVIEGAASFSHSWNPNSAIRGTHLSRLVRLSRTSVSLVRIPPGKEFFIYQSHHRGEEWIYVISGCAIAKIDGEEYEVAAGVFTGFPTQWWLTVCATRQGGPDLRRT